jgi:hypothetical protein
MTISIFVDVFLEYKRGIKKTLLHQKIKANLLKKYTLEHDV